MSVRAPARCLRSPPGAVGPASGGPLVPLCAADTGSLMVGRSCALRGAPAAFQPTARWVPVVTLPGETARCPDIAGCPRGGGTVGARKQRVGPV